MRLIVTRYVELDKFVLSGAQFTTGPTFLSLVFSALNEN